MSKLKEQIRYFRPALYTRGVEPGELPIARVIYHPIRAAHARVRKILHEDGERVTVRPAESYGWKRLLMAGDVFEMTEKEAKAYSLKAEAEKYAKKAEAAAKKKASSSKNKED